MPAAGYMTEAMRAVLEWGWDHMSLHRIEALVRRSNTSSCHLLRRLGFEREGHLRQAARWGGSYHDLLLMACVREPERRSGSVARQRVTIVGSEGGRA